MFRDAKSFSSFSVDDVSKAKAFYRDMLDMNVSEDEMDMLGLNIAGGTPVMVYEKPNHTPATYTILNIPVANIEQAVDELVKRGVQFEHYDGEPQTDEKGIFRTEGVKQAWFKDPAGNILSVIETT